MLDVLASQRRAATLSAPLVWTYQPVAVWTMTVWIEGVLTDDVETCPDMMD